MRPTTLRLLTAGTGLVLATAAPMAGAQSLRAYAGAVGGQVHGPGNCGVFSATIPSWSAGLILPTDGIAGCGLLGGQDDRRAATGPVTATQSVDAAIPDGRYQGSASARANYGSLGVAASGAISGGINGGGTLRQSAAFASFSDRLSIDSAAVGTGGTLRLSLTWTVDGVFTAVDRPPSGQTATLALSTRVNGRNQSDDFSFVLSGGGTPFFSPAANFVTNGLTIGPGLLAGSATVRSNNVALVQDGTPFDFEAVMRDWVQPCCFGARIEASFLQSARLTGIRVFNGAGVELIDWTITSASGSRYLPGGVSPVPEPASSLLALAGLAGLAALAARRRGGLRGASATAAGARRGGR